MQRQQVQRSIAQSFTVQHFGNPPMRYENLKYFPYNFVNKPILRYLPNLHNQNNNPN